MMWIGAAINALQNLLDDIAILLTDTAHVRAHDWERGKGVFEYSDGHASRTILLRAGIEREQELVAALRQRVESLGAVEEIPFSSERFAPSIDTEQDNSPADKKPAYSLDAVHKILLVEQETDQRARNQLIVATPRDTLALPIANPQATLEQPAADGATSSRSFAPSRGITDLALALHTEPRQIHPNDRAPSAIPFQAQDVSRFPPSASSESVVSDRQCATNENLKQTDDGASVSMRRARVASGRYRRRKTRLSDVLWLFYLAEDLRFPLFLALINAWHKLLEKSICSNVALQQMCRERNLGPKEIELLTGVSPRRLAELEDMCPPTWEEVVEFSDLLECSPEFLWPGWRGYVVFGKEIPMAHLDKRDIVWDGDPVFEEAVSTLLCAQLSDRFESLPEKERFVIVRYFGLEGYSARLLREIATEMRVTSARIGEIKKQALRHLRHSVRERVLHDYLK